MKNNISYPIGNTESPKTFSRFFLRCLFPVRQQVPCVISLPANSSLCFFRVWDIVKPPFFDIFSEGLKIKISFYRFSKKTGELPLSGPSGVCRQMAENPHAAASGASSRQASQRLTDDDARERPVGCCSGRGPRGGQICAPRRESGNGKGRLACEVHLLSAPRMQEAMPYGVVSALKNGATLLVFAWRYARASISCFSQGVKKAAWR